LAYSDDGDTWHTVQSDIFGTSNVDCLVYGKDRFVASAYGNKMAYSPDGEAWILAENGGLGN
jgi:hypothetical protein